MHSRWNLFCVLMIAVALLSACGGGGTAAPKADLATPLVVEHPQPTGVAVTHTSVPEAVGNYRGEPDRTWDPFEQAGVHAVSFMQTTTFRMGDGIQFQLEDHVFHDRRRFLYYLPKPMPTDRKLPLLIQFHGQSVSPEWERRNTSARFEALADRDGFVVVYANGVQPDGEKESDAFAANQGVWYGCGEVEYIHRVIAELKQRGVAIDDDRIFLSGQSAGGMAVLGLAREMGNELAGVAAVIPNYVAPPGSGARESGGDGHSYPMITCNTEPQHPLSMMFIHATDDVIISASQVAGVDYNHEAGIARRAWRQAIGISEAVTEVTPIPDVVIEGNGGYTGRWTAQANATRDSTATLYRYATAASGVGFQYIEMQHAGHGWPDPSLQASNNVVARFGFHNMDFDASDAVWEFFKDKRRIP